MLEKFCVKFLYFLQLLVAGVFVFLTLPGCEGEDLEKGEIFDIKGRNADCLISMVDSSLVALFSSHLYISMNMGGTWSKGPHINRDQSVRLAYVFSDSTLFYCTDVNCYYSPDWKNVYNSKVLDIDGKEFRATSKYHSFSGYIFDGQRQIVNGKELFCWGSYNSEESVNERFIPRIWFTSDNGRTVKCSFQFGTSIVDGKIITARHVHAVNFNPYDCSFWAQTGDSFPQSHWLKGVYLRESDSFNWELIGSGYNYKTGNMQFYEDWIIASKDISPNGGVIKVKYSEASNPSAQKQILVTPNDCLSVHVGRNGDILAVMTTYGGDADPRTLYYSQDQISFHEIVGPVPDNLTKFGYSVYYYTWGISAEGHLLSGIRTSKKEHLRDWNRLPSVWLDDFLHESGFPNAFK